jgi:cysteine desulfurase
VALSPLLFGGGQQDGIRPGTVDVVGVQEFALVAELAVAEQENHARHCQKLREQALSAVADLGAQVLSPTTAVPHILAVSLPGYEGAVLMRLLAEEDVVVGAGSACHAESAESSHVLRAMGVPERVARGQLRLSFGRETRAADIDRFATALADVLRNY